MDYVANHAASAELNKDRALVSGSPDDLAWAYFLRDVTAFAAERLVKAQRKDHPKGKPKETETKNPPKK